jgi:ubiquinone/menaquinone biosynthesis C-methylase UbiE
MSPETDDLSVLAVAAVFGRAAPTYDTTIAFFTSFGVRLVEAADLQLGERVLDVGCGRGATLIPASAAVGPMGRVVGIDLSDEMVALLGSELHAAGLDNATVRKANAQALDPDMEDETFDAVLCQMVFHLLPEPTTAAAEAFRVLVPGGRCVASVPAGTPGWEWQGPLFAKFATRALRPMDVPYRQDFVLPPILAGAGFEIVGDEQVELEFLFADEQAWWDWGWSNGVRAFYEILAPDDLEDFRQEAFATLSAFRTEQGIPLRQRVQLVVGVKPEA